MFVSIKNIAKSYDSLKVIDNVSFDMSSAQVTAILGPSGCGKSTLLRIIAGLEGHNAGEIVSGDNDTIRKSFGMVFQQPTLLSWRNVRDNIHLPFELMNEPNGHALDVNTMIAAVGLEDFAEYFPHQISGGMQARVSLARALVYRPDVLLLDEPFASIDEITRETLYRLFSFLMKQYPATVLLVTHSIAEAVLLSDSIHIFSPLPASIVTSFFNSIPLCDRLEFPDHPSMIKIRSDIRTALHNRMVSTCIAS